MSYEQIEQASLVRIGTKQTLRAVEQGECTAVLVAKDADPRVTTKVIQLCKSKHVPILYVDSMKQLGKACKIEVSAAMVGIKV
jgi:large subunit ribosomal protein L7A